MTEFDTASAVQDRVLRAIGEFTWRGTSSDIIHFIDYVIQAARPIGPDGVDPEYRHLAHEHCESCENGSFLGDCRRENW